MWSCMLLLAFDLARGRDASTSYYTYHHLYMTKLTQSGHCYVPIEFGMALIEVKL